MILAEWIYEAGIGECRAALVENGRIIEARIEPDGSGPRHGTICHAQLIEITIPGRQAIVRLDDGTEALLAPLPRTLTQGASMNVEITREALGEPGKPKRAKARPAADGQAHKTGPGLLDRLRASDFPVTLLSGHLPDRLEESGWTEVLEAAATGIFSFPGGSLRISPTPAMTLIDVDGHLPPLALALLGAEQAAIAIRLFGLAGSIGIDLPTLGGKPERLSVAAAFDAVLPRPFERTAVNGFGFLQIIRPRHSPSVCETLQHGPVSAAGRALLRRAERSGRLGSVRLVAHPKVIALLESRAEWLDMLGRTLGGTALLRADPALTIGGGHAEPV